MAEFQLSDEQVDMVVTALADVWLAGCKDHSRSSEVQKYEDLIKVFKAPCSHASDIACPNCSILLAREVGR